MASHLEDARAQYAEDLAEWNEQRAKARQIKDPQQRAAALETLGERPAHPVFGGISLAAVFRGTRRMLAPLKARHNDASNEHAQTLAVWKERRAKAREIKDPEQRVKALEALKGERPTHPALVAIGCAVVGAVVLCGIPAVRHHAGTIVTGGLTLWVIAALIAGQTTPPKAATAGAEEGEETDSEETEEDVQDEPVPTGPTAAQAHALTVSLTAGGTSLLLTRLTAELATAHPLWKPSTKAVRALLSEARITVRPGVRTPDGNGPGIHHQDVRALPSPSEAAPVPGVVANVGPGQSTNANANNTGKGSRREGFISQPHPTDPARTIIVHTSDAA